MAKFIGQTGLLYLWGKIKTWVSNYVKITEASSTKTLTVGNTSVTIAEKTSQLTNDSGFITTSDIPEGSAASTSTPLMDGTAAVGTELAFARGDHRHPSDTTKVTANNAITGATKTKITYDSKGLVTAGADLAASDIPNLSISKITDVTATAAELNVLDGITATTAELNYVDGVTSNIQTQLNSKADSSSLSSYVATSVVGTASGVCPLDANSKVDAQYLPSYVDDVVEAYARTGQTALSSTWLASESASGSVITPEAGKIYVLMNSGGDDYPTNSQYRWGGTTYVILGSGGVSELTTAEMDTATSNWT